MKVRGKKLLAAMLSLVMVLSMFVVPAAAADGDVAEGVHQLSSKGHAGANGSQITAAEQLPAGITFDSSFNYDSDHGPHSGGGKMTVNIPANKYSTLMVTVCQYGSKGGDVTASSGNITHKDATGSSDSGLEYTISNATGATEITFSAEVYVHGITVGTFTDAPVTLTPELTLAPSSVVVKMGETATVTPTVDNGTAGAYTFEYADSGIVTAAEAGGTITLTPVAAGKTTVTVKTTADGTDLSETVAVRVLPAQVGTVSENTTYGFGTKAPGGAANKTAAEDNYYSEGLKWSSLPFGNDHGPQGSGSLTVYVPTGKQTTLTVTTCCYGNASGKVTVTGGKLSATEDDTTEDNNGTKGKVLTITEAKGTVEIVFGSTAYVHSLEVGAFEDATTEPDPGPGDDFEEVTWTFSGTQNDAIPTTVAADEGTEVLTITAAAGGAAKYHNGTYRTQFKNCTIDVPVPGDCNIELTLGYTWDIQLGDDAGTKLLAKSDSGTDQKKIIYYTGQAGAATLTIGNATTTYIKAIKVAAPTTPVPNLLLDKESVALKMGDTTTDKVTATVGYSSAAVEAVSKDTGVATVAVNGKEITITAVGAGSTTVEIAVAGVKKTVEVTVQAAQTGPVYFAEGEFDFVKKHNGLNLNLIDGFASTGFTVHSSHGIEGGTGSTITLNLEKKGTITVTGCCYGKSMTVTPSVGDMTPSESKAEEETGKGKAPIAIITDAEGEVVLTFTNTSYVHSITLEYAVTAEDRKIDVWDFAATAASGENYVNNITAADWSAGLFDGGKFKADGTATFGDLTVSYKQNDRLYSAEAGLSGVAYPETKFTTTYADGYAAQGGYYANGNGGSDRRNVTIAHVLAGDKIVAYLGSTGSDPTTYDFQGQGVAADQNDKVTVASGAYEKFEFVAQYSGIYKIWAEQTSSQAKPLYQRIVRFPGVAVSGSITLPAEFAATDYAVKFVNQTNKQETMAVVDKAAKTYTATLAPGFTYTVTLSGATGWGFNAATRSLETTEAESMGEKTANLVVEAKPVCTYAGTITGFAADFDLAGLAITLIPADPTAADPVELTINADKTFTATVDSGMTYTLEMTGANDYSIASPDEVKLTSNAADQTITVAAKGLQAASGKFLGLGEGVEVTALKFKNVEDNYEYTATIANGGYTANLRAGAYAAVATVAGYTTKTHVVVTEGKDAVKDLLFVSSAAKPAVTWVADVYVDPAKVGQANTYATVREAVDAVSRMNVTSEAKRVTIHIAPGTYREQVIINTPYITLTNDKAGEVLVTWYYGIGYKYYSSGNGYYDAERAFDKYEKAIADRWGTTVRVEKAATGFRAEGITFENSFNRYVTDEEIADGVELVENPENSTVVRAKGVDVTSKAATERAAAMCVETDQAEFFDCIFLSSQDTLYTAGDKNGCQGRMYFKNCFIEGMTDYIYGSGSVVFDECTLSWRGYSDTNKTYPGYVTASRPDDTTDCKGYLFRDCTVVANPDLTETPGYWGRTWGANAKVTLLNTKLEKANLILDEGWKSMNGDPKNANYHEFGTTTLAGAAVDTSKRTEGTVMTEAEAEAVEAEDYFNGWEPYYYGTETRTVTFTVSTGASVTDLAEDGEARVLNSKNKLVALKEAVITFKIGLTEGYTLSSVTGATWDDDSVYTVTADTVVISASRPSSGGSDMVPTTAGGSNTSTVTNPDGSKTTTTTDKKGTTTVTTVATDGSKLETITTKDGDKTITVTDAKGEVQVKIELPATIPASETKFTDVPGSHWAEGAINDMAGLGLVKGVNEDTFDMVSPITRASVATILFRLSNGAEGKTSSFTDVKAGEWYADAVAWAASTGVVNGYSETVFAPNDSITREQFAVMLYRFAKLIGMDTAASGDVSKFGDAASVSEWAADAMAWCVGKGILNGTNDPVQGIALSPAKTASRAECAVMLDRFIALI